MDSISRQDGSDDDEFVKNIEGETASYAYDTKRKSPCVVGLFETE